MSVDLYPLQVLLTALAGWMNRQQQDVIAYLAEENRVLKEQLKGKRLRLDDDQRRRLAAKAKKLAEPSWGIPGLRGNPEGSSGPEPEAARREPAELLVTRSPAPRSDALEFLWRTSRHPGHPEDFNRPTRLTELPAASTPRALVLHERTSPGVVPGENRSRPRQGALVFKGPGVLLPSTDFRAVFLHL